MLQLIAKRQSGLPTWWHIYVSVLPTWSNGLWWKWAILIYVWTLFGWWTLHMICQIRLEYIACRTLETHGHYNACVSKFKLTLTKSIFDIIDACILTE